MHPPPTLQLPPAVAPAALPAQERGNGELAQLSFDHEEALRQQRLKALLEERRRLEDGAGRAGAGKVRCGRLTSGAGWGRCRSSRPRCLSLSRLRCAHATHACCAPAAPLQVGGMRPAASSTVAGAEDLVEKEARRLEVMKRRQERELAQLIQ